MSTMKSLNDAITNYMGGRLMGGCDTCQRCGGAFDGATVTGGGTKKGQPRLTARRAYEPKFIEGVSNYGGLGFVDVPKRPRGGRPLKSSVGGRVQRTGGQGGWIAHVKAYAKNHGVTYGQALKEAKASYHSGKRGGAFLGTQSDYYGDNYPE